MSSPIRPILQRGTGIARGATRQGLRLTRRVVSDAFGVVQRLRHLRPGAKPAMDDTTIARKVESEIFRPAGAPKGSVDVNVVDGVVQLRGEVKRPQQVRELERRARRVPEVQGVENLLHLPKTPSPTRADTPRRQQRTASSRRGARTRRSESARRTEQRSSGTGRSETATASAGGRSESQDATREQPPAPSPATGERPPVGGGERPPAAGEPPPREVAAEGTGRQPGPLGSTQETES